MAQPGNRPRGAPREAKPAVAAWYLLIIMTFASIAEFLPFLTGSEHSAFLMVGWPIAGVLAITVFVGMGAGKLWAVRLFRWSTYGAALFYLPLLIAAIYAFTNDAALQQDSLAPDTAIMQFIISALEPIAFFVLFRAFRRVRWLDPQSLPKEWEPPGPPVRFP